MDESARINEQGGSYKGLSREQARDKIITDLRERGLLEKESDHTHAVGTCDRCGTVVEPRLSRQWFVRAEVLAKKAIEAVENHAIRIVPVEWEKTYFEWMRNIRPWCISRQLWWGHRIPIWYCGKCGKETADADTPASCTHCKHDKLDQDEDVLDTWFSSGLWPVSTLGWPEDTRDMRAFYPTDVLETGFDILFFWVARMIMLGIHMTGKIPFHTVYLHPMVRDEFGQKMSKTKGNVKDPLDIIRTKGADSLRFTLCAMAVHGRDVLLSDGRIEGYRNFVNKLWNAARFVMMHFGDIDREAVKLTDPVNQWILHRLNETKREVGRLWEEFRFFEAAEKLYHFAWNEYCDYFLEFVKRKGEIESRKQLRDSTAVQVLEEIVRLLHPIIPFVTEEIWQQLPLRSNATCCAVAPYPTASEISGNVEAVSTVELAISIIESVRKIRGERDVAPFETIEIRLFAAGNEHARIKVMLDAIADLVKASRAVLLNPSEEAAFSQATLIPLDKVHIRLLLPEKAQADESGEMSKEITSLKEALTRARNLLSSPQFVDKAPPSVVAKEREKEQILSRRIEVLEKTLAELKKD
jgi:valyl-tRNA synthetase